VDRSAITVPSWVTGEDCACPFSDGTSIRAHTAGLSGAGPRAKHARGTTANAFNR
jgi:hypothetical protein